MNPYGNSGFITGGGGYSIPGYGYNTVPQPSNSAPYYQLQQPSMYPNVGAPQNFVQQPGYPGMPDYQNSSLYYSGTQQGYPGMPTPQQMPQQNYSTPGGSLPSWQSGYSPYVGGYGQPAGQDYNALPSYQIPQQHQGSYEYSGSNLAYTYPIADYNQSPSLPSASYQGYTPSNIVGVSGTSNISLSQDSQNVVHPSPVLPQNHNIPVPQPQLKPDRPPSPKFPVSSHISREETPKDTPPQIHSQVERPVIVVNAKNASNVAGSNNSDNKQDRQVTLNKFADLMKDMTADEEQIAIMKNRFN